MRQLLALDVGGTQLKYGIVQEDGLVLEAHVADTQGKDGAEAVIARMIAALASLRPAQQPIGIAVSSLGLIAPQGGTILGAAEAIPGYAGIALGERLASHFGLPVTVENDVNCVALAEGWVGAAAGVRNYLAVAIGTGIGGGIVINGQLYRGHKAAAGEWGYMHIDNRCWEDHASMRGLVNLVSVRTGQQLDGRQIFAARDAGDVMIAALVSEWLDLLAAGIANLIYVLNPERVVIGGGIANRPQFQSELDAALLPRLQPDFRTMSRVVLANAGNHAGMIGAVRNWLQSCA
ncbi:ROK family protein [Chitinilyticum piscinae]|uniref:ROK family protein n=1 Tax=Chitinilyticum piscinae TaxID=2866724 RepID=A0A8J7FRF3_9NEIS|nr:ROK family protein [Chitinilyticum piscinae]MBE9609486.1 ROK family protein [Chitinilyticum piscinae]